MPTDRQTEKVYTNKDNIGFINQPTHNEGVGYIECVPSEAAGQGVRLLAYLLRLFVRLYLLVTSTLLVYNTEQNNQH